MIPNYKKLGENRMETTKQKFEKMLFECGMFENQAEEVMKIAMPIIDSTLPNYKFTWDRPSDEYPEQLYSVVFMSIKPIALKWIEKNAPLAWYKPMFQ
jgi:hypothetical protein